MKHSRRQFLQGATILGTALGAGSTAAGQHQHQQPHAPLTRQRPPAGNAPAAARPQSIAHPVLTPDLAELPFHIENGVKVFHLTAEPVKRQLVPFKTMDVWGYNGSCPGPAIQVNQGDRVRIVFENRLPESTTIHWHGLEVPIGMDGVPYISQPPVPPGGRFIYEFTLHQEGTFFYHSHSAMQQMMGLIGMFIIHPEKSYEPRVAHDFGIILQGWAILPNNTVPNTANMEFNWLTFNGVAGPAATPLLARQGNRVRVRLVNLGMDHHPIHLHGNTFFVTGTEAGRIPPAQWRPENTVLVGVAQARDFELDAIHPGDWMLHCHLPHHMMNSMSDLLAERMITTAATEKEDSMNQMMAMAEAIDVKHEHAAPVAPNAKSVPGFPQDAFMEMSMDEAVAKPETHGLAANWTAAMMGMMTLVRVLPASRYDEIMAMKRDGGRPTQGQEHKPPSGR